MVITATNYVRGDDDWDTKKGELEMFRDYIKSLDEKDRKNKVKMALGNTHYAENSKLYWRLK